jgi:hypothetical protein
MDPIITCAHVEAFSMINIHSPTKVSTSLIVGFGNVQLSMEVEIECCMNCSTYTINSGNSRLGNNHEFFLVIAN